MSIQRNRILLMSGSALMMLCCLAGIGRTQTPPQTQQQPQIPAQPTPQTQQIPATPAETPPPTPAPPAPTPETTPATPEALPPVVVAPPRRPPAPQPATTAPPAPAVVASPPVPPVAPFVPLTAITSGQIRQSPSTNFGDVFFTTPGATSAGLGPGVGRPILRGLADFRVRIQENGVATGDVSDLGQDHGVPIDPLAVQKIEVMRGPQALRFGSQATGGVVEATNNRIPTAAPPGGLAAELKAAGTTVNNGWESGLLLDAGGRNVAIHADVYGRHTDDYAIPSYPYLFPPVPAPFVNGRQPNSAMHGEGAAVGGSYLFDGGYAGVAFSRFASDYQVPTLDGATTRTHIRLEQTKVTSRGEYLPDATLIAAARYWLGYTDYKHNEIGLNDIGAEEVATTFVKRTKEGKFEVQSVPLAGPLGILTSTFGTQFDHAQIGNEITSVLGPARTIRGAVYIFNELQMTKTWRALLAGRVEVDRLDGNAGTFPADGIGAPGFPILTPTMRDYMPASVSFALMKDLPWNMLASATVQRIQRAPTALELFAHGAHDAPGTFEIGNPNLQIETANTAEIGLKRTQGEFRFDGKAYYTYYNNFIFRQFTGVDCGDTFDTCGNGGTGFLQTIYARRDAIFRGAEIAWRWDVAPLSNGIFGVDGQFDFVRATFTDGSNVPQMPPTRVGGGAYWRNDNWFVRMGLIHAFAQTDVSQFETPTAGYNLLKAEIVYKELWKNSPWGPVEITTGLVGDNLLNADVRNSTQFHKDEILLPGRGFKFFLNVRYDAAPSGPPGTYKAARMGAGTPIAYKAPVVSAANWAGLYVGANAGYGRGRVLTGMNFTDTATGDPLLGSANNDPFAGTVYGVQAGYNWVRGRVVAGIEGDVQRSHQRASVASVCPGETCDPALAPVDAPVTVAFAHKLPWFATLRGRIGATLIPEVLAYITAGVAVGQVRAAGSVTGFDGAGNGITDAFSYTSTKAGWTIGAGLETQLFGNWSAKAEYLYMDFGSLGVVPSLAPDATVAVVINPRVTDHIVRVGVNYRFDKAGAVVAKF